VLKKAGIITAVVAAGAIALTPFAFAHGSDEAPARSVSNVEEGNLGNDCQFAQDGPEVDSALTGGSSLAGLGGAVANAVAPISTPVQAGNCTNIGLSDVVDSDSNNDERTRTSTSVEDSYNVSGTVED